MLTFLKANRSFFSTGEYIRLVPWRALWLSLFALFELHLSFLLFEKDSYITCQTTHAGEGLDSLLPLTETSLEMGPE